MRKSECLALLFGGLVLLTGCATPPPAPVVDPLTPTDLALRQVLAWDETLRVMNEAQRRQEQARLELGLPAPAHTLELALLLATGNEQERERALQLLRSLAETSAPELAPWRSIARFLLPPWQRAGEEQRALNERIEQQSQQLKESQKKNEQLNERIGQLNQKLEALKAIELSIPPRPASPDAPTLPTPARSTP